MDDPSNVVADDSTVDPHVDGEELLYRPLTWSGMFDKNAISEVTGNHFRPLAFMRRHPNKGLKRDTHGLSVTLMNGREQDEVIAADLILKPKAICRLTAAQVMSIDGEVSNGQQTIFTAELTIVRDKPDHANIIGLPEVLANPPFSQEEIEAMIHAEYFGGLLASKAILVWQK